MRYNKDHKENARQRLLKSGGRHAKKHGFHESGMAALASAAGVTTGSLYKHFDDKSDLFAALVHSELKQAARKYEGVDAAGLKKALADYLSLHHVRHPEQGCPLPCLTPEIARGPESVRSAFEAGLLEIHSTIQRSTGSSASAWVLLAQTVGAVMLARAMQNEAVQKDLLAAVRSVETIGR